MNTDSEPAAKNGSCLMKGLVVLLVIALVVGGVWWWTNRPIRAVELSETEKQAVAEKVEAMQTPDPMDEPTYEKGSKEIVFTERELNGLLNQQTSLGGQVKFELVTDAVQARVETDLDPDLPIIGGKRLKARARFLVTQDETGSHFVIDDVTVWGISLPNDWLGGLKGRDLIGEVFGGGQGGGLAGVESMKVERGQIRIELKD